MKKKKKFIMTEGREKSTSTFGAVSSSWNDLKDSQMDLWESRAKDFERRSIGTRKEIKTGRSFYIYVNMNLAEIGEPMMKNAPGYLLPQVVMEIAFEFVRSGRKKDIKMQFKGKIHEDTKIIISATEPLGRGKRRVDNSWYKKICVIGSEFMSGDSILARYLREYKNMKADFYKICFKFREVNKKSGISNFERTFSMYSELENTN